MPAVVAHSSRRRRSMSEINMVPFIDVMLVLLIIFMVSAPMMTTGIDIDLPKTHAARMDVEEQKLLMTITKDQKVFLGETEIPYDRLEEALKEFEQAGLLGQDSTEDIRRVRERMEDKN